MQIKRVSFLKPGFGNKLYITPVLLIIKSIKSNVRLFKKARLWDVKPNS